MSKKSYCMLLCTCLRYGVYKRGVLIFHNYYYYFFMYARTPTPKKRARMRVPPSSMTPRKNSRQEPKIKVLKDNTDPVMVQTRQHLIERYEKLVEEYKLELQEKERIERETNQVMRQIASISKQDQYLDQLILKLQEETKAQNKRQEPHKFTPN